MDIYEAIADPRRRKILTLLAGENHHVNSLADHFAVSRPAISRHLRVLKEAGIVRQKRDGKFNHYQLQPRALKEVQNWVAVFQKFWPAKLKNLKTLVEKKEASRGNHSPLHRHRKKRAPGLGRSHRTRSH